ncbi:MAG: DNA repair protein RadC [Candidatus Omnitrophica bacterium]|nr:DNA repair protein RadC [Candidatus Omnitrophota bacterium]
MTKSSHPKFTIKQWAKNDRPREKLLMFGERFLSDAELLAIILGTGGRRGQSALDLARDIIQRFGSFEVMGQSGHLRWKEVTGVGPAKRAQIRAAVEIGRRMQQSISQTQNGHKIKSSADVVSCFQPKYAGLNKEIFKVIFLNSQNRILDAQYEIDGTVNYASPIIREIIQVALEYHAVSVIAIHNHPSGTVSPSEDDKRFTRNLEEACAKMQIRLLDHIILAGRLSFSFADQRLLGLK